MNPTSPEDDSISDEYMGCEYKEQENFTNHSKFLDKKEEIRPRPLPTTLLQHPHTPHTDVSQSR